MQRVGLDELDTQEGVTYYWREAPFTGTGYELRPDGTLWSEIEFVGGKQQGVSRLILGLVSLGATSVRDGIL